MYPDYDCICMYNTTFLRTLNEEPAVYCNDCGSLKIRGLPRERPKVYEGMCNDLENKTRKLKELEQSVREFDESREVYAP